MNMRVRPIQWIWQFVLIAVVVPTDMALAVTGVVSHTLEVRLDPQSKHLQVRDKINLEGLSGQELDFTLNANLTLRVLNQNVVLKERQSAGNSLFKHYRLRVTDTVGQITVEYGGIIDYELEAYGKELARGFRSTPGIISEQGVYLSGATGWYPQFQSATGIRFELNIQLPTGWKSVSQGSRGQSGPVDGLAVESWSENRLQQEIYLIAARFYEYTDKSDLPVAMVFLRSADENLADRYLQATRRYTELYRQLLGEYPYSKFALVENFWETGYGMPSFTLLGSRVVRLPFIINSSYPHEILHNWWGNGVYVDYRSGNWSEGLTAYLADHLIKDQQGQAAQYRQQVLQKYRDYATASQEFPLRDFKSRHSSASEAIGYGKSLMLFHMLRQQLGDRHFIEGLKHFYRTFQFQKASFEDLKSSLEYVSQQDLTFVFEQWVNRIGAPVLTVTNSKMTQTGDGYVLSFELRQNQAGEAYSLRVPVAVTLKGEKKAYQQSLLMEKKIERYELRFEEPPLRLDIDPEFDLFRVLSTEETPAAFTEIFGSEQLLLLLPENADQALIHAYRRFAESVRQMGPAEVVIKRDSEVTELPENIPVMLIGWENRFLDKILSLLGQDRESLQQDTLRLADQSFSLNSHSFALTRRRDNSEATPIGFIATKTPGALPGLSRKLPHYHKYSFLAFSGTEPENRLKGRWPIQDSPMSMAFEGGASRAGLQKASPLASPPPVFSRRNMMETIEYLSDEQHSGRAITDSTLDRIADYIAESFAGAGLVPGGDRQTGYFQSWSDKAGEPEQPVRLKNVVGVIPGTNPDYAGESIVIGAHYDHLGLGWPDVRGDNKGKIHPGADDNASGVAVLLELARVLARNPKPERSLVFVAFTAEEAGRRGSRHYLASQETYPADKIAAMLNLDSVGRLSDGQLYVLGANSASEWPHIFRGVNFVLGIDTTLVTESVDSSDQVSFHEAGIAAVQLFTGAHLDYHRPSDTIDKIDGDGLRKVARVSKEVVEYLASRENALSVTLDHSEFREPKNNRGRKVSLGTVPDFTWNGGGYRLDGVVPDSPAASAGLQKGDIITKIGDYNINSIRDMSNTLKSFSSGSQVLIRFHRNGAAMTTEAVLADR